MEWNSGVHPEHVKHFVLGLLILSTPLLATTLGSAAGYNVFTFGNLSQTNVDVQGRVAVGGNMTVNGFGIGAALTPDSNRTDLAVAGILNWTNGQLFSGKGVYGTAGTIASVGTPNGTLTQGATGIDFSAAQTELTQLSSNYALMAGTSVSPQFGGLTLTGSDPTTNVFQIAAGVLATLNSLTITAPGSSTVIVNVAGTSNSFQNAGMTLNGIAATNVLFNFYQTTSLTTNGIGFKGTILAPAAAFSFNNGHVDGQVIVNSLSGTGESHNFLFNGTAPPTGVPEPGTLSALIGLGLLALGARRLR